MKFDLRYYRSAKKRERQSFVPFFLFLLNINIKKDKSFFKFVFFLIINFMSRLLRRFRRLRRFIQCNKHFVGIDPVNHCCFLDGFAVT